MGDVKQQVPSANGGQQGDLRREQAIAFGVLAALAASMLMYFPLSHSCRLINIREDPPDLTLEQHHLYAEPRSLYSCSRDLWGQGAWFGASSPNGSELIGTSAAQQMIWRHQHPQSCQNKKFFVHWPKCTGIGSQLHIMGAYLAAAMEMDRIYIEAFAPWGDALYDWGTMYTRGDYCPPNATLDTCFFQPFSSCTLADIPGGWDESATPDWDWNKDQSADRVIHHNGNTEWARPESRVVPRVFEGLLATSRIPSEKWYYWWRAQSMAYLVRPNARTLEKLEGLRNEFFEGRHVEAGTISVHVRHGDKFLETPLVLDEVYWDLARRMSQNDSYVEPAIFLSTEDAKTVENFQNFTELAGNGWSVAFTTTPRKPRAEPGAMTHEDLKTNLQYAEEYGPANEYLWSLLNLMLALDSDAWVGTLSSNWCRLVDELRATVRCKAHRVYWDAQQPHPPADLSW